ncbi:hypothetical protein [Edaphobacter bradus]|uniref:hypothetical protein n=1 Tax=Edaphobacter bradus TaxID=2259016 RepID=UPI0021DFB2B7|nr:hypothetical protein [Edaphobacter bradus]
MSNSEETIEKVLAGLCAAHASPGMERRIMEALQAHAPAQSRSAPDQLIPMDRLIPMRPGIPARPVALCGVALASMIGIVIMLPALHPHGHAPASSKLDRSPAGSLPPAPPELVVKTTQPPQPAAILRSARATNPRRATTARNMDSVALDETRAASQPPPPLPLTQQERLLLRIVHKGAAVELASLNPALRAARDAQEEEEFQRFFEPPKTADNE